MKPSSVAYKLVLPKAVITVDNERLAFLDGKDLFSEKTARAKERLKGVKLPEQKHRH